MRQHRLLEQGETTRRIYLSSKRYANVALFPLALGTDVD
jgi:hypothetical protein